MGPCDPVDLVPGSIVLGRLDSHGLQGRIASDSLVKLLERADQRAGWRGAMEAAWTASAHFDRGGGNHLAYFPDRLVSTGEMRVAQWRPFDLPDGRSGFFPVRFSPTRQRWALFDVDDLRVPPLSRSDDRRIVRRLSAAIEAAPMFDGGTAVVQTSGQGFQVWARLSSPSEPASFFGSWRNQSKLREAGNQIVTILADEGAGDGRLDPSAFAPGRYGRRPGWRLLETGEPFAARLLGSSSGSTG